jgi:hypothetical protein
MGTMSLFECPTCLYSARVCGGRDVGFSAVLRTMICEDCRAVQDVLIGFCGQDGPTGDADWDKNLDICPVCRGRNLRAWPATHDCPRCGAKMVESENDFTLWD